jgi:protein tyrosine phosphatase
VEGHGLASAFAIAAVFLIMKNVGEMYTEFKTNWIAERRDMVHCRGGLGRAGTVAARLLV